MSEIDVCFVDEDEHAAIVSVFAFQVLVDIMESITGLIEVGGGTEYIDKCRGVFENHLLVGRGFIDVVFCWKIVKLELDFLYFEVVAFHLASFDEHLGRLRNHLLEDDLCYAAATGFGIAHQQYIHAIIYSV